MAGSPESNISRPRVHPRELLDNSPIITRRRALSVIGAGLAASLVPSLVPSEARAATTPKSPEEKAADLEKTKAATAKTNAEANKTEADANKVNAEADKTKADAEQLRSQITRENEKAAQDAADQEQKLEDARLKTRREDDWIADIVRLTGTTALLTAVGGAVTGTVGSAWKYFDGKRAAQKAEAAEKVAKVELAKKEQEDARHAREEALNTEFTTTIKNLNTRSRDARRSANTELLRFAGPDYTKFHDELWRQSVTRLREPGDQTQMSNSERANLVAVMVTILPGLLDKKVAEENKKIQKVKSREIAKAVPLQPGAEVNLEIEQDYKIIQDFYINRAPLLDASRINLDKLKISNSHFTAVRLIHASMKAAELRGATFDVVDLRETDATGAQLEGASFTDTHFAGTKMHGADLKGAFFFNCDFTAVQGLTEVTSLEGATIKGTKGLSEGTIGILRQNGAIVEAYEDYQLLRTPNGTGDTPSQPTNSS